MEKVNVAIVGATGLVGQTFLNVLEEYDFPINKLFLYASKKSEGKIIGYRDRKYSVIELNEKTIVNVDIAFMSVGESLSKKYAPLFEEKGAIVIDNSNAWRNNEDCALIVPEINMESIVGKRNIIANPNCSTIQCVLPLSALAKKYGIISLRYITYQAVSGSGVKGIKDLYRGNNNQEMNFYPYDITKTCIPQIGDFLDNGYTKEEMKMVNETRKILNSPNLKISSTCIRVPIERGHGVVVYAKLKHKFSIKDIKKILANQKGVKVVDDIEKEKYPVTTLVRDKDEVIVGRIRRDLIDPNCLIFYCVADNIRKGAASNAVQIAQNLVTKNY